MAEWDAPAKLNLDLRLRSADASGFHPLRSLMQTIEWTDRLIFEEGDEDGLELHGSDIHAAELPEGGENLIWKAISALDLESRPPLSIVLHKRIAVGAGLGGGSADAAATLAALGDMLRIGADTVSRAAARVGSDVPFLLTGGTAWAGGHGEKITPLAPLAGFSVAVAVPPFELRTPEVYRRWDELGEPVGPELTGVALPPRLREFDEVRNDLTPAAISLQPELADWISDLRSTWDRPVLMSGSGPACFAFFLDGDEAQDAVDTVTGSRSAVAADLRDRGPSRLDV